MSLVTSDIVGETFHWEVWDCKSFPVCGNSVYDHYACGNPVCVMAKMWHWRILCRHCLVDFCYNCTELHEIQPTNCTQWLLSWNKRVLH